ncbi:MAG: histidinol-phosphate transaminase [Rhodospirillales bacterium]
MIADTKDTPAPNPGILDIAPYVGGESALAGERDVIKLSSNEGALGPSPKAMEAFRQCADKLHRYPDGHATVLREALAERHGLDASRIVCGAGSDEIISLLCQAYAGPGGEVVHSAHGFLMYALSTKAAGGTPVSVPEQDLVADVDGILAAVNDATRIVFIANPNNPTGTHLNAQQIRQLHAGLPRNVLLVVDAAYAEFVDQDDYTDGSELVRDHDNVVMTRTFSKIYGLGGLRLGWCYAPEGIADVLNRVRGPFNVSSAAIAAGVAAVADIDFVERARRENAENRTWTTAALRDLGLEVSDSLGNFVLVQIPDIDGGNLGSGSAACDSHLKSRGIIVRRMDGYGLPDRLRVSIGSREEMETFVNAMTVFSVGRL